VYISGNWNTSSPNICQEFGYFLLCSETGPPVCLFNSTDKGLAQIRYQVRDRKPSPGACCLCPWARRKYSFIFCPLSALSYSELIFTSVDYICGKHTHWARGRQPETPNDKWNQSTELYVLARLPSVSSN